jgi:serine/threonine protein kinase
MSIAPHIEILKSKLLGREITDDLHTEEYLAHGTFGAVFRVADRENARQFALKISLKSSLWEEESTLHYFLSDHPNIVTLHENIDFGDYAASLLDYCPGGCLHDLIYNHRLYAGDSARIKSTFLQIIDALEHCHTNNVYHRDLKPLNVLCNEDGSQVFLTDFGLATREQSSREHSVGTVAYMSPGMLSAPGDGRIDAYFLFRVLS